MHNGIIFYEDGSVQILGELRDLSKIETVAPQAFEDLKQQLVQLQVKNLPDAVLQAELERRKGDEV